MVLRRLEECRKGMEDKTYKDHPEWDDDAAQAGGVCRKGMEDKTCEDIPE
jgi:hypothetical protein